MLTQALLRRPDSMLQAADSEWAHPISYEGMYSIASHNVLVQGTQTSNTKWKKDNILQLPSQQAKKKKIKTLEQAEKSSWTKIAEG